MMTAREVSTIVALIANAKVTRMESADKGKMLKARKALRAASREYDELLEDANKTLEPEGFAALHDKVRRRAKMTDEEADRYMDLLAAYERDVEATVKDAGEAEVEPVYERLTEEAFVAFCDSNDYTLAQMEILEGALVES